MSTSNRSRKALRVLLVASLTAAALAVSTPAVIGEQVEPLALGYQASVYGDFIKVGNGIMRCPVAADGAPTYGRNIAVCTTWAQNRTGAAQSNNWYHMQFADVDSDPTTFNSSTAQATIPPGATVKYARLNWSGMMPTSSNSCFGPAYPYTSRPPGSATTQPVRLTVGSAPALDFTPDHFASVPAGRTPGHYAAYADVTSAFANAATGVPLDLTVGNIWSFEGPNCTAGWSLDIVYEYPAPDPTYAPNKRNVYIYNGLIVQGADEAAVTTTISGFKAALPTSRVGVTAYDGDAGGAVGDRFRVNGVEQREPLTNQLGNFFNGNADGNTNPGYSDTMTIDAKSFTTAAGTVPPGSTSATVNFSTSSDGFLFTNLVFSTAVAELDVLKVADPAVVHEGDTVTFTITATNRSSLPLTNVVFSDPVAPNCNRTIPTLAANATTTFTCTAVAGNADFTNVVTATGTDQFGDPITDVGETAVDVIHPAIEVVKDVAPAQAEEGDAVTYSVTVRNTGDVPLTGITVDDPLLTACNTTFVSLAVGDAITYTCAGQAPADDVTNTITATGRDSIGGVVTDTDDALLDVIHPGMAISKSVDRPTAAAGDTVTYTITVTNTGDVPLAAPDRRAGISDDLSGVLDDAAFGTASADVGTASFASPTLSWSGDLAVGATATITYTATVNDPITGDGRLINSAVGTTPGLDPGPPRRTETPIAGILVTKSVDRATANSPDTVTYTVTVTNTGQTDLTGASTSDDLTGVLDDATFGSVTATTGTTALAPPTLTWTGDLPVGTSATITYTVSVNNPLTGDGQLVNTVRHTTPGLNPGPPRTTTTPIAALAVDKVVDRSSAAAGDTVTYTITVRNTGQAPIVGASIADDLTGVLDDATFGTATVSTGSSSLNDPVLTWTGDLPVGGSATITYTVVVNNPITGDGRLDNTVTSTTPGLDSVPPVRTSTPIADIDIDKIVDRSSAAAGDTVTYTITVTNTGQVPFSAPANAASFTDDLTGVLDDATFGTATATTGTATFTSPGLAWTGDLPVGATATITYTVSVNDPLTGDRTLGNAVTGTTPGLPPQPPVLTSTPIASMEITKSVDLESAVVGDTVTYTITVTNTGQTAITGAAITDDLTGVLDDATVQSTTSSTGATRLTPPLLTWTGDLPVGGTATITYTVVVTNPLSGNGTLTNAVTNTTPGLPPHPPVITNTPIAALDVTKTVDRPSAAAGDTVTYTITVTNTGQTTTTGATITDDLTGVLDDATFGAVTATTGTTAFTSPALTWTGDLPIGATATITYTVTVNDPLTGDQTLGNAVTNTTPGFPAQPPVITTTPISALDITKTVDRTTAAMGDTVTYTITVTNTGQTTITGAAFTDDLTGVLDDATFGNATTTTGTATFTSPALTWTGDLPVGASATITYTVTVNDPLTGDGTLDNAVTGTTPGLPPRPPVVTSTPIAALDITKTVDRPSAAAGDTVTYTITVTNTGQTTTTGATITDDLTGVLDDATFGTTTTTTGTATFTAPALTWTGDLPIGGTATITYTVTVNDPLTGDGTLDNAVTNATPGQPPGPPVVTSTPIAALEVVKAVDKATAHPGETVTYTITVTNTGQTAITGGRVEDDLTDVVDDATPASTHASSGSVSFTSPTLVWTGSLAVGASATITYTVTVNDPISGDGRLENAAANATPGTNAGPVQRVVTDVADLEVDKVVDRAEAAAGDTVTYTITVTNTGQTTIAGAAITDDLTGVVDDATFGSATASAGSTQFSSPTLTWVGTLAAGASATITYTVTVNDPLTGDGTLGNAVTNTTPGFPPRPPVVTTTPITALDITKTVDRTTAVMGDTVTYTITVTNTGQTTITGATTSDDLTGVLDDATFGTVTATTGTATFTSPTLTWTGDLPIGAAATITYTATVDNPLTGDRILGNAVTGNAPGLPPRPPVVTTTPIAALDITKTVDRPSAMLGDTVTYTITVTNTGQTAIADAAVTDDLTGVLDDATFATTTASTGSSQFTSPTLTWTGTLPIGATATITYTVTVNNPLTGDGTLGNAVTNTTPGHPLQPPVRTTTPVTALDITKTVDTPSAHPGNTVTYTITVANTGQTAVPGATASDDLSGVLDDAAFGTVTATTGTAGLTGTTLTWVGTLPVGASATITYTVTVNDPLTGDGILTNAVTNTTPGFPPRPPVITTTPITALDITKTVDRTSAAVGDTVTYTITITNTGQTTITDATTSDDLTGVLDDATFATTTASTGSSQFTSPTLTWTGTLPIGATATITYTVTVNNPLTGDGTLGNAVTNTTPGFPPRPPVVTTTPITALDITKTVDRTTAVMGDTVTYTITVTNTGQTTITGATTSDDLTGVLDDATFDNASATTGSTQFASPALTWVGTLAAGDSATITYTVTVNSPLTGDGTLGNAVTNTTPGHPTGPPIRTTTPIAALAIDKTVDRPAAAAGDVVTYTITVHNTGQAPITGAQATDDLTDVLDDATFGTVTASTGSATFTAPTLTWTGDLAPAATATTTYTVTVNNPLTGDHVLGNSVTNTTPGHAPEPPVRTRTPVAELAITKTVDKPTTTTGDTVTYTITATNRGQTAITGAAISDDLTGVLDDATFGTVTASVGTPLFTSPTLTWTGDLAAGDSATITYTVTVDNPLTGDGILDNAVTDTTPGHNPTPPIRTATPVGAIRLDKVVDRGSTTVGATVTYTLTVTNVGQGPVTGARVADDLTDVLDDGELGTFTATSGSVTFLSPTLTWSGDLAAGTSATIGYTVAVYDPISGNGVLTNSAANVTPGMGGQPPVETDTPVADLDLAKVVDLDQVSAGGAVTYTLTVTNTGQVPFAAPANPASVTDNLSDVLDDARFDSATADRGRATFTSPNLVWTGDLPIGATATVTYTVTAHNPVTDGDAVLDNSVTNTTPGLSDPPVRTSTPVSTLDITKSVDTERAVEGDVVTYQVTVTNTGGAPLDDAEFTDDLSGVLDDAAWADVATSTGTASFTSPRLSWTGDLAVGRSATVTYRVVLDRPNRGDLVLDNVVTSGTPGAPPGPITTSTPIDLGAAAASSPALPVTGRSLVAIPVVAVALIGAGWALAKPKRRRGSPDGDGTPWS